jgi:hypothetical protein
MAHSKVGFCFVGLVPKNFLSVRWSRAGYIKKLSFVRSVSQTGCSDALENVDFLGHLGVCVGPKQGDQMHFYEKVTFTVAKAI